MEVMGAIKDRQRDVQYKLRGLDVSPYLGGSTCGEDQLAITPHTVEHSVASYAGTIARSSPQSGWLAHLDIRASWSTQRTGTIGRLYKSPGKEKTRWEIKKKKKETEQNRRGERKELPYSVKGGSLCLWSWLVEIPADHSP